MTEEHNRSDNRPAVMLLVIVIVAFGVWCAVTFL